MTIQYSVDNDGITIVVPETNGQLSASSVGDMCDYWSFRATRSGAPIALHEDQPALPWQSTAWLPSTLQGAIEWGRDLYLAATAAGVPLHSEDLAEVQAALGPLTFIATDDGVVCERAFGPKRKTRKMTQKRLDGGEDMTV